MSAAEKSYVKTVEGRWGPCAYFEQDEYIGKSIQHYGEYNPDETEFIIALAEKTGKDKLVLDIGANIGAIAQALEFSGFRVEAFEPQPEVFALLTQNFKGKSHNLALASRAGVTVMPKVDYSQRNNFGGFSIGTSSKSRGAIQVEVRRLDDFAFENVGLMKIDVEGFEEEVLRGSVETITRCSPVLYLEDDRKEKSPSLHAFLQELGYRWEPHEPPLYREKNFFGKRENIWGVNYVSKNIVCYRRR
jgi:FkbM family methyltransferase